ncbi:MAG: hypothetical protein CXZ00_04890 [Acidobacteria bacterium]|nr:MAG: hypothetical protein CXZ00_04890 [Acidobacteriota bacterium]
MRFLTCTLAVLVLVGAAFAAVKPAEKATLISVTLSETSSPADKYPDAQPGRVAYGPVTYTYEFKVRQGCMEYTGLYDSYNRKFAGRFHPGEDVELRATKRLLYLTIHGQETLRMSLASHHQVADCTPVK